MAIIKHSVNTLNLWFKPEEPKSESKLYKVRIVDPKQGLSQEQIRSACGDIESSKVFDFNDYGSDYHLVKAHYYHRNSRDVVK